LKANVGVLRIHNLRLVKRVSIWQNLRMWRSSECELCFVFGRMKVQNRPVNCLSRRMFFIVFITLPRKISGHHIKESHYQIFTHSNKTVIRSSSGILPGIN